MRDRKRKRRLKKRWQIFLVWLFTLGICAAVWVVGYNVLEDEIHQISMNLVLGGIIFTTLAVMSGVALTVGILDSRGRL